VIGASAIDAQRVRLWTPVAGIVSQEAAPPAARVSAAGILLDRGWGRATQPHTGEDGNDVRVVIRQIVESDD
jgi:hypothetical protein